MTKLGVSRTPTLLLLDGQNKLEGLWVGKLNESQGSEVIEKLKKACGGCSLLLWHHIISHETWGQFERPGECERRAAE